MLCNLGLIVPVNLCPHRMLKVPHFFFSFFLY
uniref:Uncharacterized protein n=1 Tax=Rhizophora mucronata TaxID=61149 RepID=A0A2P2QXM5_RHIMU